MAEIIQMPRFADPRDIVDRDDFDAMAARQKRLIDAWLIDAENGLGVRRTEAMLFDALKTISERKRFKAG